MLKKRKFYLLIIPLMLLMTFCLCSVKTFAYSSDIYLNQNDSVQISILINEDTDFSFEEMSTDEVIFTIRHGEFVINYNNELSYNFDITGYVLVVSIYKERLDEGDDPQTDIYIKFVWYEPNDYNTNDGISRVLNYYDSNVGYFSTLNFNGYNYNDPKSYNYFIQNYLDFRQLDERAIARDSLEFISDEIKGFGIDDYESVFDEGYNHGYQVGFDEGVVSVELGSDVANFGAFGRIMLDTIDNFMSFEIMPNFSLLNILQLVMTICLVILFLKFFAGG